MAWFALSLRTPKALCWPSSSSAQDPSPQTAFQTKSCTQYSGQKYESHVPHPPANIFSLRVCDPSLRPNLLATLRAAIAEQGGAIFYAARYAESVDGISTWEFARGGVHTDHQGEWGKKEK
ncbi:hypothetical protein BDU57DRAFT_457498 [Ampelomyces quisqualis]|uniref:Uncharacterized protein n=1 Tax=Ampelomyces quisqualis TaxID=50730 RepID=A0A6A5QCA5_AMPQU|nr:hypothetical protein BDU57DRAFT_457498 [Ampelomyces quisqualis]